MNQMALNGNKFILLLFAVFLLGLGAVLIRALKSSKRPWILGIGSAGVIFALLFLGLFAVRSASVEQNRSMTIQTINDFNAWQNNQVIESLPAQPLPPRIPELPPFVRPPETVRPKPTPPQLSHEWVFNNGGSQRMAQTTGRLTVELDIPGTNGALVGYSGLEPTEEEALSGARSNLSQKVKALVKLEIARNLQDPADPVFLQIVDALVAKYLEQPSAEADRFQEPVRLPQSGAEAHRAAVLTLLPKDQVPRIAGQVSEIARTMKAKTVEARRTWAWTVASALVLALFIYIIYSFLNAGTKGHLAWPLRLVSITAFLLLSAGLLLVRGHLS